MLGVGKHGIELDAKIYGAKLGINIYGVELGVKIYGVDLLAISPSHLCLA